MAGRFAQWKTLRGFPRYARTSAGSRPWAAPTGSGRARLDRPSPLGEGWGEGAPAPRYPLRWASLRSTQPTRPISAVVWITAQPYPRMEPGLPSGKRCAVFHATPGHRLDRGHGPLLREAVAPGSTAPLPWERAGVKALQRRGIPSVGLRCAQPNLRGRSVDNGAALSTNGAGACPVENAARFSTLRQDIGWIAAMGRSYGKRSRQA